MADFNRLLTAQDAANEVAVEFGVRKTTNLTSSGDPVFVQLLALMNIAGEELLIYPFQELLKTWSFTTTGLDTGDYDLPTDWGSMVPQTGWQRTDNFPLGGAVSPQEWQYLENGMVGGSTIYPRIRIQSGQLRLFPQPPAVGIDISLEYTSRGWVRKGDTPTEFRDYIERNDDIIRYPRVIFTRYLKVKYLEAKGFESNRARADFLLVLDAAFGKESPSEIVNLASPRGRVPFLTVNNTPYSGYGS